MASKISEADLVALTIPAEHVALRIANAAVVSIPSQHQSLPPTGFRLSDSSNVPATNGRPQPIPTSTGPLSPDHSKSEN
jgi:hypothetical protein